MLPGTLRACDTHFCCSSPDLDPDCEVTVKGCSLISDHVMIARCVGLQTSEDEL